MTDLRRHPPRRSGERLAGFVWLPRLIDKVRAFQAGTLGAYAYPSVTDRAFMKTFRLTPASIERAIRATSDETAIAEELRRRCGLDQEAIDAASRVFERRYRFVFALLDHDDGYSRGMGYPIPRFLQPSIWRWYQQWAAKKASADEL